MAQYVTLGDLALSFGIHYHKLFRFAKSRPDLPGLIKVGRLMAIAEDRVPEVRQMLVREGVLRGALEQAVASGS